MAASVVTTLETYEQIDQDALAASFLSRFDFYRGYGPARNQLMHRLADGGNWRDEAPALFDGRGSYGNGSAMRVAPLGAYFADDLDRVAAEAERSAAVTHCHVEATVGAQAVALAAALAIRMRLGWESYTTRELLDAVLGRLPDSEVAKGVWKARGLARHQSLRLAVQELGNGSHVTAIDTVPFCLWAAAHWLDDYETAIWTCIRSGGDVDTTGAIVGGIVAAHTGLDGLPQAWPAASEDLPWWLDRPPQEA